MKKLLFKTVILSTIFFATSCQEDINDEMLPEKEAMITDHLMSFSDFNDFENHASGNIIPTTVVGFESLSTRFEQYNEQQTALINSFADISNENIVKQKIQEFIDLVNDDSHLSYSTESGINIDVFNPMYAKLLDKNGLVLIGGDLYQFNDDNYKVLEKDKFHQLERHGLRVFDRNPENYLTFVVSTSSSIGNPVRGVSASDQFTYDIARSPQTVGFKGKGGSFGNHRVEFELKHVTFLQTLYTTTTVQACDDTGDGKPDSFYDPIFGFPAELPSGFDPNSYTVPSYGCSNVSFQSISGAIKKSDLISTARGKRDFFLIVKLFTTSYKLDNITMNINYRANGFTENTSKNEDDVSSLDWTKTFPGFSLNGFISVDYLLEDSASQAISSSWNVVVPVLVGNLRIDI